MAKKLTDLKPEEKDEYLSFIGLDDFENFKDTFGQKFFTKETAVTDEGIQKTILGKRTLNIASKLLPIIKLVSPDMSLNKLNEKHIEDNLDEFLPAFQNKLSEYEAKSKSGNDKKLNDLEAAIAEKEKSIIAYKDLAEKTAGEFEKYKGDTSNSIKQYKIKHQYDEVKGRLGWIDEPTDVQRIGFDTKISSTYKFELDEHEKLQILTSDGKPIPSKIKGGAMADPYEVLDLELDVNKLKKNNNAKQQNKSIFVKESEPANGRKLNPDYQRRLQQIQK